MSRHAVITGVSSGIGLDAARELIAHGWHVFGSVRKAADGARVQEQLGEGFTPLLFDVTDHDAIQTAAQQVKERLAGAGLDGLVNNAGIAVPGFHVTTWFDIFLTSVLAAFRELQARVGHQRLWIGPNDHYFVYERRCWPRDDPPARSRSARWASGATSRSRCSR